MVTVTQLRRLKAAFKAVETAIGRADVDPADDEVGELYAFINRIASDSQCGSDLIDRKLTNRGVAI